MVGKAQKQSFFFPDILLTGSTFYFFVATLYAWISGNERAHWSSIYFLIVLTTLLVLCTRKFAANLQKKVYGPSAGETSNSLSSKLMWFSISFGLFGLLWYLQNSRYFIWYDETTQFFTGSFPQFKWYVSELAALQQQPPIDYYLSAFAREALGVNLLSLRVHTFCFSVLTVAIATYNSMKKGFPFWLFFPWLAFLFTQSEIAQYSLEARPIAIGIFFSFLTFFYFEKFEDDDFQDPLFVTISATILLFVLGYQSAIFLFSLAVSRLLMLKPPHLFKIWKYTVFIPGAVCTPTWVYIIYVAIGENQFHKDQLFKTAKTIFMEQFWNRIHLFYQSGQGSWSSVFIILFAASFFALLRKKNKCHLHNLVSLLSFGLIFPVVTIFTWSFINWYFAIKYFALWISGSAYLLLNLLASTYNQARKTRTKKVAITAIFLVSVAWISANFVPYQRQRLKLLYTSRPSWNEFNERALAINKEIKNFIYLSTSENPQNDWNFLTGRFFDTEKMRWSYVSFFDGKFSIHHPDGFEKSPARNQWVVFINAEFLGDPTKVWELAISLTEFGKVQFLRNDGILLELNSRWSLEELIKRRFPRIAI